MGRIASMDAVGSIHHVAAFEMSTVCLATCTSTLSYGCAAFAFLFLPDNLYFKLLVYAHLGLGHAVAPYVSQTRSNTLAAHTSVLAAQR